MVAKDFKADGGLMRSCKHEVREYSCRKMMDKDGKNAVKLSQVLLCLASSTKALDRSPGPKAMRPPITRKTKPTRTQAGTVHQSTTSGVFP